jgi:hypothetical protein
MKRGGITHSAKMMVVLRISKKCRYEPHILPTLGKRSLELQRNLWIAGTSETDEQQRALARGIDTDSTQRYQRCETADLGRVGPRAPIACRRFLPNSSGPWIVATRSMNTSAVSAVGKVLPFRGASGRPPDGSASGPDQSRRHVDVEVGHASRRQFCERNAGHGGVVGTK